MKSGRMRTAVLLILGCAGAEESVGQQVPQVFPLGTEFRVNSSTTNEQSRPRVASDAVGDFVVVWESDGQDGDAAGVFAQRFARTGNSVGTEFQVNTYTTNKQQYPAVAMDNDGDLVVVWQDYTQDGDVTGSFGQRYASSGAALGTEFRANEFTTSLQNHPVVAADADGDFVVVWNNPDVPFYIEGRRFSSSGVPQSGDFQIAMHDPENLYLPEIAAHTASGRFTVVWECQSAAFDFDVCARRYDSAGAPLGTEFVVNTATAGDQNPGAVAADPQGNVVIVWNNQDDGTIDGQRFTSSGIPQGTQFQVSSSPLSLSAYYLGVAADSLGFIVVWENSDPNALGVFAQRYQSNGSALGTEFRVNTYTTADQLHPAVAADGQGDFVVAWADASGQDGSLSGVYAQRYTTAFEVQSQTLSGAGSFGTDTGEADGANNTDLLETTVTTPIGGPITIIERPRNPGTPPSGPGFTFLGQQVSIEATSTSDTLPLRIVFELDVSSLRGQNPSTIQVYRNGVVVPNCAGYVTMCTAPEPAVANPDPCVAKRCTQSDGDVELTVLTSAASTWEFAAPCYTPFTKGLLLVKENVPGKEKLVAKLLQGPLAAQADFGNPLVVEGTPYRLRVYNDVGMQVGEAAVSRAGDLNCSGGATACWSSVGGAPPNGKGYKYKDLDKTADGVSKILLKASPAGTKILFKASGPAPPFPTGLASALTSTSSVTLQFNSDDATAPTCFATTLIDIKTQAADKFKAK